MLNILIADDHEIVRRGLRKILLEEFSFVNIDEAWDAEMLLDKAANGNWDMLISDLNMPKGGGVDMIKRLRDRLDHLPILVFSINPEDQYAVRVIKAGANGYLGKDAESDELLKAIHRVLAGKIYINASLAGQLDTAAYDGASLLPHETLSEREMEVFRLLVAGQSISEIAAQLSLSNTTISTYRVRILAKMNMKTNAELTLYAAENNLF
ncbi:MAG TPA: response regulator transcription factor [Chitinophagaceae bacterium]|jgi:DNA-binding NarL/FixJ family response regulator|nr:response regulator transcription factor [Chitinophagaceae bacterium]